ncbi:hypothetical protein DEM34_15050 [Spiribacter halobius]|uniref:Uncharacterized protein n=2 Tax=Sediminicurvatus halobius TaxID=2182432 RepID=A0A2U2MXP2_9GAMM|nr:hypothetical protein DEM34_15050 [Spiribacter halobius]
MRHPFSGVIQGNQVNGESYSQPGGGEFYQRGGAQAVQAPGAAEAAIMGGGGTGKQIYGVFIGADWVYFDSDGVPWLVSLSGRQSGWDPQTLTLELRRFGRWGGAEAVHSYSVVVSDWGQATPADNEIRNGPGPTEDAAISIESTTRDGSRAVLMLYLPASNGSLSVRTLGFLECVLSGPGSAVSAEISVLRTRAQTLGSTSESWPPRETYYIDANDGTIYSSPPDGTRVITVVKEQGTATLSTAGRILALVYDASDTLREITGSLSASLVLDAPDPTGSVDTELTRTCLSDESVSMTVAVSGGGSQSISWTVNVERDEVWDGATGSDNVFRTDTWSMSWGGGGTSNTSREIAEDEVFGSGATTVSDAFVTNSLGWPMDLCGAGQGEDTARMIRYSPTLIGYHIRQADTFGGIIVNNLYIGALGPAGEATGTIDAGTSSHTRYYGSQHPVTGETYWAEESAVSFV